MPPKRGQKKATPSPPASAPGKRGRAQAASVDADVDTERETFDVNSVSVESPSSAAPPRKQARKAAAAVRAAAAVGTMDNDEDDNSGDKDHVASTQEQIAQLSENTLQALLDGAAVPSVVDVLLDAYRSGHATAALCAVLNVIAKASGVTDVELDGNALTEGIDISPLLDELYARIPAHQGTYLPISKEARSRRFKRAFPTFCEKLVQLAYSADVLLDNAFLPTLGQWVVAMSESKSRAFRHTATVALLGMMDGLNRLVVDLRGRVAMLRSKKEVNDLQRHLDDIVEWRNHLFSQGVHQRVRDVAPEIRLGVFQSLKEWVLEYPEDFMENKYLRYFGMPLHDKKADLRLESLDLILRALARVPEAYQKMHLFLQYFLKRLVEMSGDVDVRCAEMAIRVCALLVRGDSESATEGSELLSNDMVDRVLLSLFDERPTVRVAAGVLLKVFIHCRTVGEETEAEQVRVATELLCAFASTLRTQYGEEEPEKYLVDALWSFDRPPLLLTEYKPILDVVASENPVEACVGLGLLTALLEKLQNTLTLGPLPKDDRRHAQKKLTQEQSRSAEALAQDISAHLGVRLNAVLERHRGDVEVVAASSCAVAALKLNALASPREQQSLTALLLELRKTTVTLRLTDACREALVRAWHALAFQEHPLQTEAQGHLQELLKQIVKQVAATRKRQQLHEEESEASGTGHRARRSTGIPLEDEDAVQVWGRLYVISSLVSLAPQWSVVHAALTEMCASPSASPTSLRLLLGAAVHCTLWLLSSLETAPSSSDAAPAAPTALQTQVAELVQVLTQLLQDRASAVLSGAANEDAARLVSEAFVYLCDLVALQVYNLSQAEAERLVRQFDTVVEALSAQLSAALAAHKEAVAMDQQAVVPLHIPPARRRCSALEAAQVRVVTGIARFFLFRGVDRALAPAVLWHWTQTPSKTVSDIFKGLFHLLRDRSGDSFSLERDILVEAYNRCALVGATPASVDVLSQTGSKLASLHFIGTDRFYPACVSVVQFGIQFACSTDPLMLEAVAPYCAKLAAGDAMQLVRQELATQELFISATNPYARSFIGAMRRAAKLDAAGSGMPPPSPSSGVKRARAVASTELGDDQLLSEIARTAPTAAPRARGSAGKAAAAAAMSEATRVITNDGWHVRSEDASHLSSSPADARQVDDVTLTSSDFPSSLEVTPNPSQVAAASARGRPVKSGHRSVVNVPSTQEMTQSSMGDGLDGEVFVATEEYDE